MKKLLCLFLGLVSMASASIMGLEAMGEEHSMGGSTSTAGRGFSGNAKTGEAEGLSVVNPARFAFDTKVVFNLNFLIDWNIASAHGSNFATTDITMPSFNFSFPMGDFGAVGVGLWQSYASIMDEEIADTTLNANAKLSYQGSVYEVVPTYALRLPFFRQLSLGVSAHVVLGNTIRSLTLGPDNSSVSDEDSWATNNALITDYVEGSWEIEHHPAYYSAALQYRGRQASFFFSYTMGHNLLNKLEYNFRFSEIDTLAPTKYDRLIKVPATMATGVSYRLFKRHNIMADFQLRGWDEDIENIGNSFDLKSVTKTQNDFIASIGYQRDGSPLFYDSYFDRMYYRAGAWYKNWYIEDVKEIGGSIGVGLPFGVKGTMVDVAFQGGVRLSDSKDNWDETFFGLRIGLMGVSTWGQGRR